MYANLNRMTTTSVVILILLGVAYYFLSMSQEPDLYEGDVRAQMTCPLCRGTGKIRKNFGLATVQGEKCKICGGDGKSDSITPGPNRPVKIRGAVYDRLKYRTVFPFPLKGDRIPSRKTSGALVGATITVTGGDGSTQVLISDGYGWFLARLVPGAYTVTVEAVGYRPTTQTLQVKPLTGTIWPRAYGPYIRSPEERRSNIGDSWRLALKPQ